MRGRRFNAPSSGVRPTQDRVRESLFNVLAEVVPGARVLDLYAGSGALGLEACSRNARDVCWVESDRSTLRVLRDNVHLMCGDGEGVFRCVCADALRFIRHAQESSFDLIFADPPYDKRKTEGCLDSLLNALNDSVCLTEKGLFVYETTARECVESHPRWECLRDRHWGRTRVIILRQKYTGDSEFI